MKKFYRPLLLLLLGLAGLWVTLRYALPIGLPFLIGYGISRMARHPEQFLQKKGNLPAWLASYLSIGGIFALFFGIFYLLGYILFVRLQELAERLPQFLRSLQEPTRELYGRLEKLAERLPDGFSAGAKTWLQELFEGGSGVVQRLSTWLLDLVGGLLSALPGIFLFLLAVLLSAWLFSSRTEKLRNLWRKHIPKTMQSRLHLGGRRLKKALGGYIKAELRLCAVTFGIVAVGLFLIQDFSLTALPLALLIAIVDALPVFGSGTVLIPWSIVAILQGNSGEGLGLLLLYGTSALGRALLEPKFLGKQMGLDPLLTLLSLYGGYRLFGIGGMILTPIFAMLLRQIYTLFSPGEEVS